MRRGLAALFATAAGLALLLGYKTSPGTASRPVAVAPTTPTTAAAPFPRFPAATAPPPPGVSTPPTTVSPATTAPASGSGSTATGTFTGPVVETRYGPVQVQVTLAAGKVTDVQADELPFDRSRSAALSQRAAPVLRSEALAAQGARIDSVSGASITSRAYAQSLQAALDAAHA